jgi:hypothetical protein
LAVVDGAATRLPLTSDQADQDRAAMHLVVRALADVSSVLEEAEPARWLESANDRLRQELMTQEPYAHLWPLLVAKPEPLGLAARRLPNDLARGIKAAFRDALGEYEDLDTRFLRLCLPACVATAALLDLDTGRVTYGHVGDSVLVMARLGMIKRETGDQMGPFDAAVLNAAAVLVAKGRAGSLVEAAADRTVQQLNLRNGLYHNAVAADGRPTPAEGCGVLNGLQEISAYVETGELWLQGGATMALMSDGMALPLSVDRTPDGDFAAAIDAWRLALVDCDARRLLLSLQDMLIMDTTAEVMPRLKQQDDATAVMASIASASYAPRRS